MAEDETVVFCHAVKDLPTPTPDSFAQQCEWPGCRNMIWVHPVSVEIVLAENGRLICMRHRAALEARAAAEDDDVFLVVHPLQSPALQELVRSMGGLTREEIEEERARRGRRG